MLRSVSMLNPPIAGGSYFCRFILKELPILVEKPLSANLSSPRPDLRKIRDRLKPTTALESRLVPFRQKDRLVEAEILRFAQNDQKALPTPRMSVKGRAGC